MSRSTFQKSRGGADPVKYQRIVGRVGPQLSVILDLSKAIRAAIVENVAGKVMRHGGGGEGERERNGIAQSLMALAFAATRTWRGVNTPVVADRF